MNEVCLQHSGLVKSLEALCNKIDEREKLVNIQLASLDKALGLASREMERRLEGMNEFREQLNRQAGTFLTTKEFYSHVEKMDLKMSNLAECQNVASGSKRWTDHIITVIIAAIVMLVFRFAFKV